MTSHIPFCINLPKEDPFILTDVGQPVFHEKLMDLFTAREVDSGIPHAETPSASSAAATPPASDADVQSTGASAESVVPAAAPDVASITALLGEVSVDTTHVEFILASNFRMSQLTCPKIALVFVGNLSAEKSNVELTWQVSKYFKGCGVLVSRKVWHQPTALVQFQSFEAAVAAVKTSHVIGGRVVRVLHSKHSF